MPLEYYLGRKFVHGISPKQVHFTTENRVQMWHNLVKNNSAIFLTVSEIQNVKIHNLCQF